MGIPGSNFVLYVYHAEPDLFKDKIRSYSSS
jgi:hypothetical protein